MRRFLRIGAWVLGSMGVLLMATLTVAWVRSEARLARTWSFDVTPLPLPTDPAEIARGGHLAATIGECTGCHGDDLGGKQADQIPLLVDIVGPNLTSGEGSVTVGWSAEDWVRALRHGVKPDGRPMLFMPISSLQAITDVDMAAIIAWARSVPPVDRQLAPASMGVLGRALWVFADTPMAEVETIDHGRRPEPGAERGPTVAYGAYLAATINCRGCHGADLRGGRMPGAPPGLPEPQDLTAAGPSWAWTLPEFIGVMRSGAAPDGRKLDPLMPFASIGQLGDDELEALYRYLHEAPAMATVGG